MHDIRINRLAEVLVGYSLDVQEGQVIELAGSPLATPLLVATCREVLKRGAHPLTRVQLPGIAEAMLENGTDAQLGFVAPTESYGFEQADGMLRILSDYNTKSMSGIDPTRQQIFQRARTDMRRKMLERSAAGDLNWCVSLFPTDAFAQDAEMSIDDYAEFVFRAGLLDREDPVAEWQKMSQEQARLIAWLSSRSEIHVTAPGTDLKLNVGGRTWMNADGHYNFPDGEIFTGPIENSTNGHVRFTFPSSTNGREVENIRLEFHDGKVVNATAAKNEEFLNRMLDTDEGARLIGEFAIGTNPAIDKFTGNILFDEKIGGTLHMAVGSSYPETGGLVQSAVHWDMICDLRESSEIRVDGELFMKDGEFTV